MGGAARATREPWLGVQTLLKCRGQGKPSALYSNPWYHRKAQRKVTEREGGQRKAFEGSHWADLWEQEQAAPKHGDDWIRCETNVRHPLENTSQFPILRALPFQAG